MYSPGIGWLRTLIQEWHTRSMLAYFAVRCIYSMRTYVNPDPTCWSQTEHPVSVVIIYYQFNPGCDADVSPNRVQCNRIYAVDKMGRKSGVVMYVAQTAEPTLLPTIPILGSVLLRSSPDLCRRRVSVSVGRARSLCSQV